MGISHASELYWLLHWVGREGIRTPIPPLIPPNFLLCVRVFLFLFFKSLPPKHWVLDVAQVEDFPCWDLNMEHPAERVLPFHLSRPITVSGVRREFYPMVRLVWTVGNFAFICSRGHGSIPGIS